MFSLTSSAFGHPPSSCFLRSQALEEVPLSDPEFTRLFLELARVREEFKSTALTRPAPSIYGGTEENPNEGSAFGGRLSFSVVQRDFDDHDDPTTHGGGGGIVAAQRRGGKEAWPNKLVVRSTDPGSAAVTSVVNYQLLRLTFLYNKVYTQYHLSIYLFIYPFNFSVFGNSIFVCLSDLPPLFWCCSFRRLGKGSTRSSFSSISIWVAEEKSPNRSSVMV